MDTYAMVCSERNNRLRLFVVVKSALDASGVTIETLAKRLGKSEWTMQRLINSPIDWTLDDVSDFMFAIDGSEIEYRINSHKGI